MISVPIKIYVWGFHKLFFFLQNQACYLTNIVNQLSITYSHEHLYPPFNFLTHIKYLQINVYICKYVFQMHGS